MSSNRDGFGYPSDDHLALREAIAEVHGLDAERIVCGAGSDEIIALLCQAYAGPGNDVIYTEHGFLMYRISAMAARRKIIYRGFKNRASGFRLVAAFQNTCPDKCDEAQVFTVARLT